MLRHAVDADRDSSGKIILPQDSEIEKPVKKLTLWLNGEPAGAAMQTANHWWLSEAQMLALINVIK